MPNDVNEVLADLLSRDRQRVLTAVSVVNKLRDLQALTALAGHLPDIERATAGLELGGYLFPNSEHLRQAVSTLQAWRDGLCRCWLYPQFLTYDPLKEEEAGDATVLSSGPPDWHMDYRCRCNHCGAEYKVEQREGHLTWWQWYKLGNGAG